MIVDELKNAHLYRGLSQRIARALDYLCTSDVASRAPGTYPIDETMHVRVLEYPSRTPDKGVWEAHRKYLDLQYVAEGVERIRYAPTSRLTAGDYDVAKDVWRFEGEGDAVTVPAGSFILLWPTDGHMPFLAVDQPAPVKKVVVKIAVA